MIKIQVLWQHPKCAKCYHADQPYYQRWHVWELFQTLIWIIPSCFIGHFWLEAWNSTKVLESLISTHSTVIRQCFLTIKNVENSLQFCSAKMSTFHWAHLYLYSEFSWEHIFHHNWCIKGKKSTCRQRI